MRRTQLSTDQKREVIDIAYSMNKYGVACDLVISALEGALAYQDMYKLLKKWSEYSTDKKKAMIIKKIEDLINILKVKEEEAKVRLDDLDEISKDIRAFKDNLRVIVDEMGGIKYLSKLTGIPQPSLSRFFNSSSMPRRTTLHKIAAAIHKSRGGSVSEWYQY